MVLPSVAIIYKYGVAVLSRDHADQSNPCFDIWSHDPIMAVLTNSVNSLIGTAGYISLFTSPTDMVQGWGRRLIA